MPRRPKDPTASSVSRSSGASKPSPSSAHGQHDALAEPAQVDVDAGRVGVALDVGQRLLEDPAQLAQRERGQRPDVVERAADARAGPLAPARRLGADRGRQRQLGVVAAAQAAQQLARLLGRRARVLGQLARVLDRARPGRRWIRRESASAEKPIPCTVLASESCMSRASRSRSACAASVRSCSASVVLGLGLAVEQAPRARPRDGHDRVQRRQHDQRAEVHAASRRSARGCGSRTRRRRSASPRTAPRPGSRRPGRRAARCRA